MPAAALSSYRPRYCVWELTLACNLRCTHCGSAAGRPRPDELTTTEALDVVAQLADLECRLITLSGGEPTLRPDWDRLAAAAVQRGVTVNMVTNGMTMDRDTALRARDAGMSNLALSLDGPETLHESVRGSGTFGALRRAVEAARGAGLPVSLLTHLTLDTLAVLRETHDVAVEMGAGAWRVQLGKPMGHLARQPERLLRPEDLLDLLPMLADLKRSSPIWIDVGDSIGYYGPHESTLRRKAWGGMRPLWTGCQAGRFAVGIESDGGVKGCLSLQAGLHGAGPGDPFREGSLRERRLEELWFAPDAFAFNRQQRVEDLTGACRSCRHSALCRGGAKCVAAAFTGALGEDPFCYSRVQREAQRRQGPWRSLQQGLAAAAMGLLVGGTCLGGCTHDAADKRGRSENEGTDLGRGEDGGGALDAGIDLGPDDYCATHCCDCEYGDLPGPPYDPPAPGHDGGSAADQGFPSPGDDAGAPVDAGHPVADAGAPDASWDAPDLEVADTGPGDPDLAPSDAGVTDPCANVCCACEYGDMPPPECCGTDAGAADPCANVCCDCDYGDMPPAGCCPPDPDPEECPGGECWDGDYGDVPGFR